MPLIAYNLTTSPVTLAAGTPAVILPASTGTGVRGAGTNVTSELRGLSGANYISLQAQVAAVSCEFQWTGTVEYTTGTMVTLVPTVAPATRLFTVTAAAKGTTEVHALYDSATLSTSAGFTNPDVPRNLRVTKSASWDGGTVTITGTDQFDAAITEVFPALGAGLEVGTKIFKTVTALAHSIALAGGVGVSVGCGDLIGIPAHVYNGVARLWVGTTGEAVTIDTTYHAFTPTTTPSATTYILLANIAS